MNDEIRQVLLGSFVNRNRERAAPADRDWPDFGK